MCNKFSSTRHSGNRNENRSDKLSISLRSSLLSSAAVVNFARNAAEILIALSLVYCWLASVFLSLLAWKSIARIQVKHTANGQRIINLIRDDDELASSMTTDGDRTKSKWPSVCAHEKLERQLSLSLTVVRDRENRDQGADEFRDSSLHFWAARALDSRQGRDDSLYHT